MRLVEAQKKWCYISMEFVCDDILYLNDISWHGRFIVNAEPNIVNKYFETWDISDNHSCHLNNIIEDPVLVIDTLHSCYSHALIEEVVPFFSIIKAIHPEKNWKLFIRKRYIELFPKHNIPIIDNNSYRGVWKELTKSLSPYPPIFEHTLPIDSNLVFKHCYIYPCEGGRQRSIWSGEYYPGRGLSNNIQGYSDSFLYSQLSTYREYVLSKYGTSSVHSLPQLLLIERKNDRRFEPRKFAELHYRASLEEGWLYDEPYILEDMDFAEQVNLFRNANIFIFRHGSCLTNLLWIPNGSIVFDLDTETNRKGIVERVCLLTGSTHHYMDYNHDNIINEIFDIIRAYVGP